MTLSCWAEDVPEDVVERFEITRFEVEGNTLFSPQTVDNLLSPFAGRARDFGSVQKALEALEEAYHKRGFSVVQVVLPEQELNNGVVRLKVVEVHIGKVIVEGNNFFDVANIRRSLPGLREGETPNVRDISASLKIANENPSKKIVLDLRSTDNDDVIDAGLKVVDQKAWKLGLNLDNSGNAATGETHVGFLYSNANVWGLDHVGSLQYTTTAEKPEKVHVFGLGYHIPLYSQADSLDFFGSYSNVDSGTVASGILNMQVSGRGTVLGARYNHKLERQKNFESTLIYAVDYRAYKNNVELSGLPGVQLGKDVTVHPISMMYSGIWTLPSAESSFSVTVVQNVAGGGSGGAADFNLARLGAPANYNLLRFGGGYNRVLADDWQMRLNVSGQYTRDMLIPGEQFGAGGAATVRGFSEREISDDSGYATNVEVYTPNFCSSIKVAPTQCRILAFVDTANMFKNDPAAGEKSRASIGSAGFGVRLMIDKYLTMQIDYGQVIDADGSRSVGDKRLHLSAGFSY